MGGVTDMAGERVTGGLGPTDDFYRRVLDQMPAPIVVCDDLGTIVYGNALMARTMGLTLEEARGRNIVEFVHADDRGWAVDAFLALVAAGTAESAWAAEPWATVRVQIVDDRGTVAHDVLEHDLHADAESATDEH